jgi:hypothetical protein
MPRAMEALPPPRYRVRTMDRRRRRIASPAVRSVRTSMVSYQRVVLGSNGSESEESVDQIGPREGQDDRSERTGRGEYGPKDSLSVDNDSAARRESRSRRFLASGDERAQGRVNRCREVRDSQ